MKKRQYTDRKVRFLGFEGSLVCYKRTMKPLPRNFYDRPTIDVAKDLLGKLLVNHVDGEVRIGKIVETEAYLGPHDLAAHSARGRTKRTEPMFGPPGHAYVYLIYGMYSCMNVVTEPEGHASAVLIRALEPIEGIEENTKGPGLLCRAMKINRRLSGHDLLSKDFFITEQNSIEAFTILKRPRVGVDYAKHWAKRLLRFSIKGNTWVSVR